MERRKLNISDTRNGNGVNFEIPLADDFATNLHQGNLLSNNYIEEIKENSINKIVNYEKYIFYPAYLDKNITFRSGNTFMKDGFILVNWMRKKKATPDIDKYSHDVSKINFHLYLKHREQDENNDYGSWESSDEFYWNRWDGTKDASDKKVPDNIHSTEKNGDLLGCLGFTDEDVFYQKNSLKKSFLRISIYDSPYRQTQKLLYYATLFFDTNVLYKKYVKLNEYPKQNNDELRVYQYQYKNDDGTIGNIPDSDKLTATFTCTTKNDDSACSDGFYLYLFNTVVKSGQCTQLYMKVEFNNAKYGKTVVLTNPRKKSGANVVNDQIPITDDAFPTDYEIIRGSNGNSYVDVNKLYSDLYIPIFVRYNNEKDRYEWYIASNEQNKLEKIKAREQDVIDINLYEPRINKLKD